MQGDQNKGGFHQRQRLLKQLYLAIENITEK
jgi:hypothetical protein